MNNKINLIVSLAEELNLTPENLRRAAVLLDQRKAEATKDAQEQKRLVDEYKSMTNMIDAAGIFDAADKALRRAKFGTVNHNKAKAKYKDLNDTLKKLEELFNGIDLFSCSM